MPFTIRTGILAMAVACCASAYAQTLTGTARVTDADTIQIGSERIRLQGVDAPETDQICLDSRGAVWNCGIDARDRLIQSHWIARDFLRHQRQRCFRSVARDLLDKRGRLECVASSRRGTLVLHRARSRRCRLAKSEGLTLRNVGPSHHGLDEQMFGAD